MASFPDPEWFLALGGLMAAEGELFRRLGYAEVRFAIRVLDDESGAGERATGLEFDGYALTRAEKLADSDTFDPDFVICGRRNVWDRMLQEIVKNGRSDLRHTLSSLALVGEELWLESSDQLREDKFYRVNQTLQEFFNLAAKLRD
jgi:hypothetical protein